MASKNHDDEISGISRDPLEPTECAHHRLMWLDRIRRRKQRSLYLKWLGGGMVILGTALAERLVNLLWK